MITIAAFLAGAYFGFRLGARYVTLTNLSESARTKVRDWLHTGDTK